MWTFIEHIPCAQYLYSPGKNLGCSWVLVAHTCNPIYLRSQDREDDSSRLAVAKQFMRPSSPK
jgi:hypothetical protein